MEHHHTIENPDVEQILEAERETDEFLQMRQVNMELEYIFRKMI